MNILKTIPLKRFLVVSLLALFFAACKKDTAPQPSTPVAGFMAFNLAPDQNAVVFALSGNNIGNSTLSYNAYTGGYYPINTGSREVRTYDNYTNNTLATTNGNFVDSMYYSSFLIGSNGNYRNVLVQDKLDSLPAATGKAYVRYLNAIPDSTIAPDITLQAGSETPITENAAFGNMSAFKQVTAGSLTTTITNEATNLASRVITVQENKVYTLLLTGIPGSSDTTKTVRINYIENGSITP